MEWKGNIERCVAADAVLYTSHARREMKEEAYGVISEEEVYEAVLASEVIEEYPDDRPYPSALLFGVTRMDRPLHIVCAYDADDGQVIVVTVYHPDPERWRTIEGGSDEMCGLPRRQYPEVRGA